MNERQCIDKLIIALTYTVGTLVEYPSENIYFAAPNIELHPMTFRAIFLQDTHRNC